jgi:threonine dehydratase
MGPEFGFPDLLSRKDVEEAGERICASITRTSVLKSDALNEKCGVELLFKCENFQQSGSFKYRGVSNAVIRLGTMDRKKGVITHSSGNHGAALAAFARKLKIPCLVVMPDSASEFKRQAIYRYGAEIIDCESSLESRESTLEGLLSERGMNFIPPYDHADVIAGQGTCGLELLDDVKKIDELWVPVGGGGLAGGNVLSVGEELQVVGAEPALARDAYEGLKLGVRQPQMEPMTCADGLRTALGELNFSILTKYKLPIRLVTEEEIIRAQSLMMSCLKILVETSAAVPFAALLKYGPHQIESRRIGVIVSGGNILV